MRQFLMSDRSGIFGRCHVLKVKGGGGKRPSSKGNLKNIRKVKKVVFFCFAEGPDGGNQKRLSRRG